MEIHFFQGLPERAAHKIFSFLTFSEIVRFRTVDKYFNSICSRILNQTFLSLSYSLDSLILRSLYEIRTFSVNNGNENKMNKVTSACLRHKIYKILKSEASVLYAVCGRYIEFGIYSFAGGKILDYYENVISSTQSFLQTHSNITVQLFLLNQEFMDYFEEVVEPAILKKYSSCIWFGTKILDLLDSYISSNFHIEATYNGRTCQVSGRYEILNAHSLAPPPKLKIANEDKFDNLGNLRILVTYLRNQVRWNNFFHCIDSTCIQENLGKSDKKCRNPFSNFNDDFQIYDNQKAWSDENGETPEFVFDKTFSRWIDNCSPSENICFSVGEYHLLSIY